MIMFGLLSFSFTPRAPSCLRYIEQSQHGGMHKREPALHGPSSSPDDFTRVFSFIYSSSSKSLWQFLTLPGRCCPSVLDS